MVKNRQFTLVGTLKYRATVFLLALIDVNLVNFISIPISEVKKYFYKRDPRSLLSVRFNYKPGYKPCDLL